MTTYTVKAHLTRYEGVEFRSRLEARWAAFFDWICVPWEYEPIDLAGWVPDFHVVFRSGEPGQRAVLHPMYVEIKPYRTFEEFAEHLVSRIDSHAMPAPAMFGLDPEHAWMHVHEGDEVKRVTVYDWLGGSCTWIADDGTPISMALEAWKEAGNLVQWRPRR